MKSTKTALSRKSKKLSDSYNRFKEFHGKQYTGMTVGRTHHWHYDKGDWKEKKASPDKWEFAYTTVKRRLGKAPEGSGVPIGTGYHWFILAHQYVEKLNANDYITQMVGLKYKLSHKRTGKDTWSVSGNARRKHLVGILKCLIAELEKEPEQLTPVPLALEYNKKPYKGTAIPVPAACNEGACFNLDITLNNKHLGIIRQTPGGWKMSGLKSRALAQAIGKQITQWYADHPQKR